MRKRISSMWNIPKIDLQEIVQKSDSISKILRHYKYTIASGNYRTLKERLNEEQIDYSHISLGLNNNKGRKFPSTAKPLEEVMIKNSTYYRGALKRRLLKEGILRNECSECGQKEDWNDKKLVMVLDHINGVNNDHRLENLRMLCPNCNSQQKTFCGKKIRKKYYCKECGKEKKSKNSQLCYQCSNERNRIRHRKVKNRPSKEQLLQEVKETSYCAVGKKYGVSDNCIRKWLKGITAS